MNPRASWLALAVLVLVLLAPSVPSHAATPSGMGSAAPAPGIASASSGGVQPLAATLSFSLTASTSQAEPKDTVLFSVYFNNTGTQSAPAVWINVTTAAGLGFLGDTASGNLSGYPDYRFSGLSLGLHSFTMRFVVAIGTPPGTRLGISGTLVYSDGSGGQQFLGPAGASILIGVVLKQLYLGWGALTPGILTPVPPTGGLQPQGTYSLSPGGPAVNFDLTPPLARSFHVSNATAVLYLQPLSPPATIDVNLTLVDVNGGSTNAVGWVDRTSTVTGSGYWTLYYTFPSLSYTFAAGHAIRLQVLNAAATGQIVQLATNATAEPSQIDLQTTTYVSVDSLAPALVPTTYLSPKSSLVVTANVSDPFGSAEITVAHANVTGPGGPLLGWTDAFPVVAVDPSTPSKWKLFRVAVAPPLQNGTYTVEVTAVERNGVTDIADGGAVVRAPAFTLQKVASPTQGKSGTKITYFVWYNNTGSGPAARVWLNDTLPSQVTFQNSSASANTVSGNTYGWVFNSVPVGPHVLQIFVHVGGGVSGVSYIRNWASLNYSDPQGFLWAPALRSHADVVLNGPLLGLTQTSVPVTLVHSNQVVVYTINVTNTGDAAATVWLNDTVPSGLVYVSDTATGVGGTRTIVGNRINWTFAAGMPAGTTTPTSLAFTMTARAASGLSWGTALPNVLTLNDTSTNGVLMPDQVHVLALTVASPSIASAAASFGVPNTVPGADVPLYVNFTNAGNEAAGTTWLNLTLDASLAFVSAGSVPATVAGSTLELTLPAAAVGPDSVPIVVRAAPSVADRQVLSVSGTLQATDGYANLLPPVAVGTGSVAVALPNVTFHLTPSNVTAEAGTSITYTVSGGNAGSGTASVVWLNLTLPSDLVYVNDTFGVAPLASGSGYSWTWRNYSPGPRSYGLVLAADRGAPDGAIAPFGFAIQALDAGGGRRPSSSFGGRVNVRAPAFDVRVWASQNETSPTGRFAYTLSAENIGSTTAQTLWLTDAIDGHLAMNYYTGNATATGTSSLNWTFHDVAPGQTITFTVFVSVGPGTAGNVEISNTLVATYTNSLGTVLVPQRSTPSLVLVAPDPTGLFLILGGGSAVGSLLVVIVYRRYRVRIEDVFLIYRDGILVSHLSQGDGLDKDEDQLSGMLTAVQDFVKDAFTYGEHRELHQLEFGDYHVLIERGKLVYLAVVYQGRDSGLIRKKVRTVLDQVESRYGGVFDAWDGDMARVAGTRELLREGFVEDKHPWSLVKSRPG